MSDFTGYTIAAKPVLYKGINYRSRLEATWAAFFDILGWRYVYEPQDFSGWYPDFAILGRTDPVYVEVKPVYAFPENVAKKIDESGCPHEVLILGLSPIDKPLESEWDYMGDYFLGWLKDRKFSANGTWGLASFTRCLPSIGTYIQPKYPIGVPPHWDFFHTIDSYGARYCGWGDGDHHLCTSGTRGLVNAWGAAKLTTRFEKHGAA